MASKKQQVADMLNAVKTGNARALTVLHPTIYKQHNPEIADGPTGIRAVLFAIKDTLQTNIVRIFQDGEYVFAHMDYFDAVTKGSGARVAFDIWRFEDGQVVEHWDNFQINHSDPNPFSGRTMTDGPTEVTDLDRTETNKAVVRELVEDRIAGRFDKLADYFVDGVYIQHNPTIDTSLAGLAALGENGPVYNRLHLVLGEGNFVLTTCEGSLKGQPTAFFDLFRLENGKIREHWDTIETIPPKTEHKNDNGKFEGTP
ncbi:hypothetical protein BV898_14029 [Hypsibius exemplaris]|uniref:SnoaL-like domain-containing protein n=1 Tax=Hypsibius exemplaris TaxID=2072580 RepID=A0A1W0W906_HYPEX|nr:hypothetical protein BV898_14029 [Hypsibius exemplaris]